MMFALMQYSSNQLIIIIYLINFLQIFDLMVISAFPDHI